MEAREVDLIATRCLQTQPLRVAAITAAVVLDGWARHREVRGRGFALEPAMHAVEQATTS